MDGFCNTLNNHRPFGKLRLNAPFTSRLRPNAEAVAVSSRLKSPTALSLQVFGLGPSEILMTGLVGLALWGPDRLRSQTRKRNGGLNDASPKAERLKERAEQQERAEEQRRKRRLRMIRKEIEKDNQVVIQKVAEFEELYGKLEE